MLKMEKLWSDLHQSYFVVWWCVGVICGVVLALIFRINYFESVWWCVGVICGVVLALIFRINYFESVWWCVLSVLLMVWAYFKPKYVFVVVELFGSWTPFLVTMSPYQVWVFVIYVIILVVLLAGQMIKKYGRIKT